jgi:hypothetical protein
MRDTFCGEKEDDDEDGDEEGYQARPILMTPEDERIWEGEH